MNVCMWVLHLYAAGSGERTMTLKLLSEDPAYPDAPVTSTTYTQHKALALP